MHLSHTGSLLRYCIIYGLSLQVSHLCRDSETCSFVGDALGELIERPSLLDVVVFLHRVL